MNDINEARKIIEGIKERRAAEITAIKENLEQEAADLARVDSQIEDAKRAGDPGLYAPLKEQKDNITARRTFYVNRLEQIRRDKNAYIPQQEYDLLLDKIHAEISAENVKCREKTVVALEALRLVCDTLTDTVNAADSVLLELQSEIRRDYNVTARITPAESALLWFLQDVIERAETAGYLPKPAGIK